MKVKCINDNVTTKGLTRGKIYTVLNTEECGGELYRIIDDSGKNRRYSSDFFIIISTD